jgi:hypothetical protein
VTAAAAMLIEPAAVRALAVRSPPVVDFIYNIAMRPDAYRANRCTVAIRSNASSRRAT